MEMGFSEEFDCEKTNVDNVVACLEMLKKHVSEMKDTTMKELFEKDPERFNKYCVSLEDLVIDFSKNIMNEKTMDLLFELLDSARVSEWRDRMYSGDAINFSEKRSVLHIALRNMSTEKQYLVNGRDVMPDVRRVLKKIESFTNAVRSGTWRGHSGRPITDIVNIGIGGSNLGPKMVTEALKPFWGNIRPHFVSNVDGTHIAETVKGLDYRTTMFIISSKTFTTQETMKNAYSARYWFLNRGSFKQCEKPLTMNDVAKHFVAVSTNTEEVMVFGIDTQNMFEFWDWVGGRYSLWSAIGLSVALTIGFDRFSDLLSGAHAMDEHFLTASPRENLPIILALLGVWYRNCWNAQSMALLPYDQYLSLFPSYFQQADMESNGKQVTRCGVNIANKYETGPIVWGTPGTDGQHAFYQLIHQGTTMIPCDFIAPIHSQNPISDHHTILLSNMLAQSEALMRGKDIEEVKSELKRRGFKDQVLVERAEGLVMPGNRPSNVILFDKLTPRSLGMLIAMYEHKIFVQGVIWGLNSFDQPGVELGKVLARVILPELQGGDGAVVCSHDCSTNGLINLIRQKFNEEAERQR